MNDIAYMRPNTADDYKVAFKRGHRMLNKGSKRFFTNKDKEEKKENRFFNQPPIKRAGTSNLLFRKTSKSKKPVENNNYDQEFSNTGGKGFHMNLFEKYQSFLV